MSDIINHPEYDKTWRPIDTMPTDGRLVMVYCKGGICIIPALPANPPSRKQRLQMVKNGVWPNHSLWTPTHWIPLPEPPK